AAGRRRHTRLVSDWSSGVCSSDLADPPLALAPAASIALSARALLAGRIAPESIDLISPRLLLFFGDDGSLSVKFSHPGEREESEIGRASCRESVWREGGSGSWSRA